MTEDSGRPISRIELVWPGKGSSVAATPDGWAIVDGVAAEELRPLIPESAVAGTRPSFFVCGDRVPALTAAARLFGSAATFAFADIPRVNGYDETRAFQVASDFTWSTWLSVVANHLRNAKKLLSDEGVLVAQIGDLELPFARLLLDELFGRTNYLGTILWQSHYSPKGGKPTNEIAAIHEYLLAYAIDKESCRPIATLSAPEDYSNPDNDPRGPWQAKQKDAGRDTVKLTYHIPPYRWRLVSGQLPPGLWRISPMSGVIYGTPTATGNFTFEVAAIDADGNETLRHLSVSVQEEEEAESDSSVWWLDEPITNVNGGQLSISSDRRRAVVGKQFQWVLRAAGGHPYVGEKRPSRGWAFGKQRLVESILEDRCHFGRDGKAIPEPKKYLSDLADGLKRINLSSWWAGKDVGFSQDATKNLNELLEGGVVSCVVPAPKPESLLGQLIESMTKPGEKVVEVFCRAGDLAAVAQKTGRGFLSFVGGTDQELSDFRGCALPRLIAVQEGHEVAGDSSFLTTHVPEAEKSDSVSILTLGPVVATHDRRFDFPLLAVKDASEMEALRLIVAACGFIVTQPKELREEKQIFSLGRSVDGTRLAYAIDPSTLLEIEHVATVASSLPSSVTECSIFFFTSEQQLDAQRLDDRIRLVRVPMDLRI